MEDRGQTDRATTPTRAGYQRCRSSDNINHCGVVNCYIITGAPTHSLGGIICSQASVVVCRRL